MNSISVTCGLTMAVQSSPCASSRAEQLWLCSARGVLFVPEMGGVLWPTGAETAAVAGPFKMAPLGATATLEGGAAPVVVSASAAVLLPADAFAPSPDPAASASNAEVATEEPAAETVLTCHCARDHVYLNHSSVSFRARPGDCKAISMLCCDQLFIKLRL